MSLPLIMQGEIPIKFPVFLHLKAKVDFNILKLSCQSITTFPTRPLSQALHYFSLVEPL